MDKLKKKRLRADYKKQERQKFEESLPLSRELFFDLFDFLDVQLEYQTCQDDFLLTQTFLEEHNVDVETVRDFLEANGAYCDCEVLYNVADLFEDQTGWEQQLYHLILLLVLLCPLLNGKRQLKCDYL